jgi:hypothetical protein
MTQTMDEGAEVREMVNRWLGTNFGQWTDAQVQEWAGRFRNENDAPERLMELLKDQKQALFPEYDREADYQSIAAPWRNMMTTMWGTLPQDSDTTLHSLINLNDAVEGGKMLTREGLNRGNQQVINNIQGALHTSFGGAA